MFGCMKAYSLDLRQKILRAYDQQLGSQRAIAALFGVSQSFVEKLLRRWRRTGAVAARPHGGGSRPRCDGECAASIIFADRDNYFCRLSPRLIDSVRLHFIVYG